VYHCTQTKYAMAHREMQHTVTLPSRPSHKATTRERLVSLMPLFCTTRQGTGSIPAPFHSNKVSQSLIRAIILCIHNSSNSRRRRRRKLRARDGRSLPVNKDWVPSSPSGWWSTVFYNVLRMYVCAYVVVCTRWVGAGC
jgi:hypothetical protein